MRFCFVFPDGTQIDNDKITNTDGQEIPNSNLNGIDRVFIYCQQKNKWVSELYYWVGGGLGGSKEYYMVSPRKKEKPKGFDGDKQTCYIVHASNNQSFTVKKPQKGETGDKDLEFYLRETIDETIPLEAFGGKPKRGVFIKQIQYPVGNMLLSLYDYDQVTNKSVNLDDKLTREIGMQSNYYHIPDSESIYDYMRGSDRGVANLGMDEKDKILKNIDIMEEDDSNDYEDDNELH